MKMGREIIAYTDGGCHPNPGPGGFGVVLVNENTGRTIEMSRGPFADTTNNRMEMLAVTHALELLATRVGACRVRVFTDSQYVKRGLSEWVPGWKRRGWVTSAGKLVLNKDLWLRLDRAAAAHEAVVIEWVKGHAGNKHNERADVLATRGRKGKTRNDKGEKDA